MQPLALILLFLIPITHAQEIQFSEVERFLKFEKNQQLINSMKSLVLQANSVLDDSILNVNFDVSRSYGNELSGPALITAGGVYPEMKDNITSRITLLPKNVGVFNSSRLDLSLYRTATEYQLHPEVPDPRATTSVFEMKFSYDVIKGGFNDPFYLQGKRQQKLLTANFYELANTLSNNYFTYHAQILDLKAAYCKFELAKKDFAMILKIAKEVELAFQLKSVNYKQYLNIIDTKNFIERNLISYEVQLENQKRTLSLWEGQLSAAELDKMTNNFSCVMSEEDIKVARMGYTTEPRRKSDFKKTLSYKIIDKELEGSKYSLEINKLNTLPEVRPYISVGQDNQVYETDKRVAVGITVNWDMPGNFQKNVVKASKYDLSATRSKLEASLYQFISENLVLTNLIEKNKTLLETSLKSLDNSNKLIRLLEVQKDIGQIDSVSLSNAYTQRNQIYSSVFESIIAIQKNYLQWKLQTDWKDLMSEAGLNIQ